MRYNLVAVLMGGISAERLISLDSGRQCADALRESGYQTVEIDACNDVAGALRSASIEACFNALHGRWGEDGCIQGMLEILQIPYTHSGVLASALCMDKPRAKIVFKTAGIPVAAGFVLSAREIAAGHPMDPPYVVKPVNEGSSVGVDIVAGPQIWRAGQEYTPDTPLLVEEYIPGRELSVTVYEGVAFGVTDIVVRDGFYDYRAKYQVGGSQHILPARIPSPIYQRVIEIAQQAYQLAGCRDLARADFRWDGRQVDNAPILLEMNTQPGMTKTSLAPEQAEYAGVSFVELVTKIMENASCCR